MNSVSLSSSSRIRPLRTKAGEAQSLDERALDGLARSGVVPFDPGLATLGQDGVGCQFGAIVRGDHPWPAPPCDKVGQLALYPLARYRGVGHRCQALASYIIDHVEHLEPAARHHLIMHEVQAPALVGQRGCRAGANSAFAALSAAHRQAFLAIESLGLLAVEHVPIVQQQNVQAAIVEPAALMRQIAQLLAKFRIVAAPRLVADHRPFHCNDPACPPLADIKQGLKARDRFPLGGGRYHFLDSRSFRRALSSIAPASSRLSRPFSSSSA
jgi:hypothetical protein